MESNLQTSVLEYLNGLPNCVAENVSGNAMQSGRADINGCYQGRCFRIELKVPDHKNKTSLKQRLNLRRWQNAGAVTVVAYSIDFIKEVFSKKGLTKAKNLSKQEDNGCVSYMVAL